MEGQTDLFNVAIDEKGKENIRKIYPSARIVLVVGMIAQLIFIYFTFDRYFQIKRGPFVNSYSFGELMYSLFILVNAILFFLQAIFFIRFAGMSNKSIENKDNASFNSSFSWLLKGLYISLMSVIIHILYFFLASFVL